MRSPSIFFLLFVGLLPWEALCVVPLPTSAPCTTPSAPERPLEFFIESATYIPSCQSGRVQNCTPGPARLIIKGDFVVDVDKDSFSLGLWVSLPETGNYASTLRWEGVPFETFQVTQDPAHEEYFDPLASFRVLRGTLVLKDSKEFPLSAYWTNNIPLGFSMIDEHGKAIGVKRPLTQDGLQLSKWVPSYPSYSGSRPSSQPATIYADTHPAQPMELQRTTPTKKTLDEIWKEHQGEILASQLSLLLLAAFFPLVRRARSLLRISVLSLAGALSLTLFSFILVGAVLPNFAFDIAPSGRAAISFTMIPTALAFGWVSGSLLALLVGVSFLLRATPSLDLRERCLFISTFFVALASVGFARLLFLSAAFSLLLAFFYTSSKRLRWYHHLKQNNLAGLQIIENKEASTAVLYPVFYHTKPFVYDAIVRVTPKGESPYREQALPLWLTSLQNDEELAPAQRRSQLGFLFMLVIVTAALLLVTSAK
jgi:hypothetical protein